jgi:sarcosine oxidase subunit alpha
MVFVPQLCGHVAQRDLFMRTSHKDIWVAGDASGIEEASAAMVEGRIAGVGVAKALGHGKHRNIPGGLRSSRDAWPISGAERSGRRSARASPAAPSTSGGCDKLNEKEKLFNGGVLTEARKGAIEPPRDLWENKKNGLVIIECPQRIPCNPCHTSCPTGAVKAFKDINDQPEIDYEKCTGCARCVAVCPGLACFVVDLTWGGTVSP